MFVKGAGLLVLGFILASAVDAHAEGEVRFKLDLDYDLLQGQGDDYSLRPMLRTEQRFQQGGLALLKVFVGVRSDLRSWLLVQGYYAHKDKLAERHVEIHMLVFDFVFHLGLGPVTISDRSGHEWHSRPGFFRYRNDLDLHVNPGLSWLRLFVADEIRIDSDQARMNRNDFKLGVELLASSGFRIRTYYDLESDRRLRSHWLDKHVLQLMLIFRLGADAGGQVPR